MQAKLTVIGGKANKRELSLNVPVIVGRSREVGLTIAHPMVSRQHCEIFEADGALRIRDLGSTNGTFVGGKKVPEAVLRPHDQFSVGPLTFEIDYQYVGDATVVEERHGEFTAGDARAARLASEAAAADEEAPLEAGLAPGAEAEPVEDAAFGFSGMVSDPPEAEVAPVLESPLETPPAEPMEMEFVEQPAEAAAEATEYYSPEDRRVFAAEPPVAETPEPAIPFASFESEAEGAPDFTAEPQPLMAEAEEASVDEIPVDPVPPPAVAAWEAPDDVLPLDVEPAAPQETSSEPTIPPPPPATEEDVTDFATWSARQAGEGTEASPPEPVTGPGLEVSGEPDADSRESPWESPADDAAAPPPPVAATQPKRKKRWWPFGKDKESAKNRPEPASSAPAPDFRSFGNERGPAVEPSAEGPGQAAEPPLPPSPRPDRGPPTADDEREADLDDFLKGLG